MPSLREAATQALEALDWHSRHGANWASIDEATETLRAALAEPATLDEAMAGPMALAQAYENGWNAAKAEQGEPVAWMDIDSDGNRLSVRQWSEGNSDEVPLYTAPPQRKPLTEEEIEKAYRHIWRSLPDDFDHTTASWIEQGIRYAEQAHGVK